MSKPIAVENDEHVREFMRDWVVVFADKLWVGKMTAPVVYAEVSNVLDPAFVLGDVTQPGKASERALMPLGGYISFTRFVVPPGAPMWRGHEMERSEMRHFYDMIQKALDTLKRARATAAGLDLLSRG